ncbi:MAG: hypothetical protein C0410_01870 [Anaerolinea sp.]|nr:hypothetical protein [Anaerolinea sp.]
MGIFLTIVSLIFGVIGFLNLSEATTGVGLIAIGCLFGIVARIAQASKHQKELMEKLSVKTDVTVEHVNP